MGETVLCVLSGSPHVPGIESLSVILRRVSVEEGTACLDREEWMNLNRQRR